MIRLTNEALEAALHAAGRECELPYSASIRDYVPYAYWVDGQRVTLTPEQEEANAEGKRQLKAADAAAWERNKTWMRGVIEAALHHPSITRDAGEMAGWEPADAEAPREGEAAGPVMPEPDSPGRTYTCTVCGDTAFCPIVDGYIDLRPMFGWMVGDEMVCPKHQSDARPD